MIVYQKVRIEAAAARKRMIDLERRRARTLYRDPPPERVAPPVSLPVITTKAISDSDIGLPENSVAQQRAEEYLRCAIAARLHEEAQAAAKASITVPAVVRIEVDDESLHLAHCTDHAIYRELRRLEAMPLPRWMAGDPGRLAS